MARIRTTALAIGFVCVALGGSARGVTLATPVVAVNGVNRYIDCAVNNIGTGAVSVTVSLFGTTGGQLTPQSTNCGSPISPKHDCEAIGPIGASGYCIVTSSSSKVRVDALVFDNTTGTAVLLAPGTK
jgi:hypothetical protein